MAGNVVVKLLQIKPPAGPGTSGSNAAHLKYISSRPGVDRTITDESLSYQSAAIAFSHLSSNDKYLAYIGTRPGVDKKGVHSEHLFSDHGLFGEYGVPDMKVIADEIRSLRNSPMYRFVISLDERTAGDLGFTTKEKWESLMRNQADSVADNVLIPREDMQWVAALHRKDGHPHVHLAVWDKKDRTRYRGNIVIPKANLNQLRTNFTKAVYAEKRIGLYAIKNSGRDMLLEMAKDNAQQVREFLRQTAARPAAVSMPSPSNTSIKSLSQSIKELAEIMPDGGRVNYAFMPENVKAKVDSIVNEVLSNQVYSSKLGEITKAVRALTEQFTGKLDKIESATDKAAADIGKRVAQQILNAAADVKNDIVKFSIHDSVPHLMNIKKPVNLGAGDTLKLFHCLAAAGVDRQAALIIANKVVPSHMYEAMSKTTNESIDSAESLVKRAYDAAKDKVNIKDWKRIEEKLEAAEERAITNEHRAEAQTIANASTGLLRSVFALLQRPKGKNPLHQAFDQQPQRRKRDALYTKDELEY